MELTDYLRILRAHWIGVVLLSLGGVLAAAGYSMSQPKVYEAQATGFISSGKQADEASASMANSLAQSRVASYVAIATSTATATRVLKDPSVQGLRLATTPSGLAGHISVSQPPDTVLVQVTARAGSPQAAATLANAWVKALSKEVRRVEGHPTPGQPGLRMEAYGSAELPTAPVLPRTKLNLLIGLLLGALLGFSYALIRHRLDRRLRSTEVVEKEFQVSVIGAIPFDTSVRGDGEHPTTLAVTAPGSARSGTTAEGFRTLRTNLAFMDVDKPPRIIVVTSPKQGDGKSTVAANLAAAMAIGGQPVTLVDGDLRRPTVARSLGLVEGAGLTDVLVGRVRVEQVMQVHPDLPGLSVLGSGVIPPNPSELLGSQAMRTLLSALSREAMVVIDAPPLLPVTDAAVLTRSADGAIVVVTHGSTLDTELAAALSHLERVHGRVLGIVFNRMRRSAGGGAYGTGYYQEEYKAEEGRRRKGKPARQSAKSSSAS